MTTTERLLAWYEDNRRALPWRGNKDAYRIYVSEIILQQTRVVQGLPYYQRFIAAFPDVRSLAEADISQVLHLWQGLGYYSRARNMHAAACQVVRAYQGSFPMEYKTLLTLPGVGPYTAAAVASIAGGQKVAVVDGNVIRVISRLYGITSDTGSSIVRSTIRKLTEALLADHDPGEVNQAIMEFGALQCTPGMPDCQACPLQADCAALAREQVADIPRKTKKSPVSTRYLHALVILVTGKTLHTYLHNRIGKDIWEGLFTFPFIEADEPLDLPSLLKHPFYCDSFEQHVRPRVRQGPEIVHVLTHQKLQVRFFFIRLVEGDGNQSFPGEWQRVAVEKLDDFPMPRLMHRFLEQYPGLSSAGS